MSRSRARRLLLAMAFAGGVGLLSSLAPWSVGVAESRTPVIKPVEEPRAGDPADPDFGQLKGGYESLPDSQPISRDGLGTADDWFLRVWFTSFASWLLSWRCGRRLG